MEELNKTILPSIFTFFTFSFIFFVINLIIWKIKKTGNSFKTYLKSTNFGLWTICYTYSIIMVIIGITCFAFLFAFFSYILQ